MKPQAVIVNCSTDEREHMMLDSCWNCAPFWWKVPRCPTHNRKLTTSGWCLVCRKFYDISGRESA